LDICSPSYGQKKGRESNWQFDSRPLKVGNRPLPDVCSGSATRRWKATTLVQTSSRSELGARSYGSPKSWESKPGQFRDNFGTPPWESWEKSHLDVASVRSCREYYKGEGGGFPQVRVVVNQVSPS
jgi:hypothetical protein